MARFYLFVGLLSLAFFSWAQYRGIGLFDDVAAGRPTHLNSSGSSTFHK